MACKIFKNKIIVGIFIVALSFIIVAPVLCAGPNIDTYTGQVAEKAGYDVKTDKYSLSQQVGTVIKTVLSLTGMIFLALTVYAGILWMTAAGSEDKVKQATDIIKMATIGLIIVISAYSITSFVMYYSAVPVGSNPKAGGGAQLGT